MVTDEQVEKAIDFIRDNAPLLAEARGKRVYLEEYRKSKKAMLFISFKEGTVADREARAYSDPEYIELLRGLEEAVKEEERLRWMMTAAQVKVEVWRTQQANRRVA